MIRFQYFLLLFLGLSSVVTAQQGPEVGGWIGVAQYFGDLNKDLQIHRPGLSGGLNGRYNFNNRIAAKVSVNYIRVSAFDSDADHSFQKARNLSFKSSILDFAGQFEFNFLPYVHGSKDNFYTPYLFAGFNVFNYSPKAKYEGKWVELQPLGTEGQIQGDEYKLLKMGLVYGAGLKLDLNDVWSLNFELSARRLGTDYLDDVSTVYADKNDIEAIRGPVAAALSDRSIEGIFPYPIGEVGRQRGDSEGNDSYAYFGISIMYYFASLKCPPISRPH
ncbi:MAG: DUF6089 family protein [Saprospiraceae bacterium]